MKRRQKRKHKKTTYILLGLSILAAIILGVSLLSKQHSSNSGASPTNQQNTDIPTGSDQSNIKDNPTASNNKPSEEVPSSQTGTISIVSLDQSGGYVNVRAEVTNFTPQQCVYSFKIADGKPVVREQSNGCGSISIPQGEFDRIGVYTLTVTAYSDSGGQKLTASKEIDVR